MKFKRVLDLYIVIIVSLLFVSCVTHDDDLDLSRDISLDVGLGDNGGISFPLGNLGKLTLDSLIKINKDSDAVLRILDGGLYGIEKSGTLKKTEVKVASQGIDIKDPVFEKIKLDFTGVSEDILIGDQFTASFKSKSVLNVNDKIDDAVLSVGRLELVKPTGVDIGLTFTDLSSNIEQAYFDNVCMSFPGCVRLLYYGSDPRITVDGPTVTMNGMLTSDEIKHGRFSVEELYLSEFVFNKPLRTTVTPEGKRMIFSDDIVYSGEIDVFGDNLRIGDLSNVSLSFKVSMEHIDVKRCYGRFYPDIDDITEGLSFNLNDDLDFLKSEDNEFDVSDISINVNMITTNLSYPLLVDMSFDSKTKDGRWIGRGITPDYGAFRIPPAPIDEVLKTLVRISNHESGNAEGVVEVYASRLGDLVRTVPDSLFFKAEVQTDTTDTGMYSVRMGENVTVSGDYEAIVPFRFNSIKLNYYKLKDVSEDIKDVREKLISANLHIRANVTNTVPMDVVLTVTAMDANDKEISSDLIHFGDVTIPAGSLDNPNTSDIEIDGFVDKFGARDWKSIGIRVRCVSGKAMELMNTEGIEIKNTQLDMTDVRLDLSNK